MNRASSLLLGVAGIAIVGVGIALSGTVPIVPLDAIAYATAGAGVLLLAASMIELMDSREVRT